MSKEFWQDLRSFREPAFWLLTQLRYAASLRIRDDQVRVPVPLAQNPQHIRMRDQEWVTEIQNLLGVGEVRDAAAVELRQAEAARHAEQLRRHRKPLEDPFAFRAKRADLEKVGKIEDILDVHLRDFLDASRYEESVELLELHAINASHVDAACQVLAHTATEHRREHRRCFR